MFLCTLFHLRLSCDITDYAHCCGKYVTCCQCWKINSLKFHIEAVKKLLPITFVSVLVSASFSSVCSFGLLNVLTLGLMFRAQFRSLTCRIIGIMFVASDYRDGLSRYLSAVTIGAVLLVFAARSVGYFLLSSWPSKDWYPPLFLSMYLFRETTSIVPFHLYWVYILFRSVNTFQEWLES